MKPSSESNEELNRIILNNYVNYRIIMAGKRDKLLEEIKEIYRSITLEELENNPTKKTVFYAYYKGYFEAMDYCIGRVSQ